MESVPQISAEFIESHTDWSDLIAALRKGFSAKDTIVPPRHHHNFPNPEMGPPSTLLLMPAWSPSQQAGVKIVTVSPANGQLALPAIQGVYLYLDAVNGTIKAILEAKSMTAKRTAAASALASYYLSREDSNSLLMIGTGALAVPLIQAHAAVRPLKHVFVWGRDAEKSKVICAHLSGERFSISHVDRIEDKISDVDIVSCATLSATPLVLGRSLADGQHVDLVGAYRKDMRESDDATIARASVFVDTYQGGLTESGDIVIPLQNGTLDKKDVKADLFSLCSGCHQGRTRASEITVFKSVGHALEDLIAAKYYYNQYTDE